MNLYTCSLREIRRKLEVTTGWDFIRPDGYKTYHLNDQFIYDVTLAPSLIPELVEGITLENGYVQKTEVEDNVYIREDAKLVSEQNEILIHLKIRLNLTDNCQIKFSNNTNLEIFKNHRKHSSLKSLIFKLEEGEDFDLHIEGMLAYRLTCSHGKLTVQDVRPKVGFVSKMKKLFTKLRYSTVGPPQKPSRSFREVRMVHCR